MQPIVVCMDHQSLQSWHKEHVNTPSGLAARRARWHETLAKFDLSVVYVPGQDKTVSDWISRWAYPAGTAWMDISMHGDAEKTAEAKRIIEAERLLEEGQAKCFVVMGSRAEPAKVRDAKVQALEAQVMEEAMVRGIEGVQLVLMEDWSDDYANSDHQLKYWNSLSASIEDDWPEELTDDGEKLFLKHKLLVPENRVEDLIDHWHNVQMMYPGRDKSQKDLESRFLFPPGYYAMLNRYSKACAVFRATKHPNRSTAGNSVYRAIPESPMRLISMDVLAMPKVILEGEVFDCVILAGDCHIGYIMAVLGKISEKKDKSDKHRVGLQAKTVAQAMIRHWLTVCDVLAMICSDRST